MSRDFDESDQQLMGRALALARRGRGRVEPNPMVGCVIARAGRVVGEGYHRRFGGPHAEVEALRDAGPLARGSTAYVTLEPCCHHGKTPPCTQALIDAGVTRVIAAHMDPFPAVRGRGFTRLVEGGVTVESGLLGEASAELNAPFMTRVLANRPYVIAKWAQSLDGRIATRTGDSRWISGEPARRMVHRLRARVDAVAVGVGTVLRDDPQLTARDVSVRRVAARVVFDSRLRLPPASVLAQTANQVATVVLTTRAGGERRVRARLERLGVEVLCCRTAKGGTVSLPDALRRLAARMWTNLLVEGGAALLGGLFDSSLVDEAHVFTAPLIIGGDGAVAACGGIGARSVDNALRPRRIQHRTVGRDRLSVLRLTSLPTSPA